MHSMFLGGFGELKVLNLNPSRSLLKKSSRTHWPSSDWPHCNTCSRTLMCIQLKIFVKEKGYFRALASRINWLGAFHMVQLSFDKPFCQNKGYHHSVLNYCKFIFYNHFFSIIIKVLFQLRWHQLHELYFFIWVYLCQIFR